MYKIYEKDEAIKLIQKHLVLTGDQELFIAPTGVYDENTRLSVIYFQNKNGIPPTGIVDNNTFDLIYSSYLKKKKRDVIKENAINVTFPILPGKNMRGMEHINYVLAFLMDYYGQNHNVRINGFYTTETEKAVKSLRSIYLLEELPYIDEMFYEAINRDFASISRNNIS